jgi:hypothetical protein
MSIATKPVSDDLVESTRKNGARIESDILRRLADVTQDHAATCMGISPSTVSRMRERIGELAHLLAAIDMQVAASNSVVVDKEDQRALKRMAYNWLKADLESESLDKFAMQQQAAP